MDSAPGEDIRGQYLFATQSPKVVGGIICTMLVVLLWVGSSELSQFIFDNEDYSKPFFMTAFNSSLFSFYLLGFIFCPSWRQTKESVVHFSREDVEAAESSDCGDVEAAVPLLRASNHDEVGKGLECSSPVSEKSFPMRAAPHSNGTHDPKDGSEENGSAAGAAPPDPLNNSSLLKDDLFVPDDFNASLCSEREDALLAMLPPVQIPWYKVAELAAWFVWIWLLGGYLFNISLCFACGTGTSVSANQVISGTSALWALVLSCLVLGEEASAPKLVAVLVSCAGAALITGVDFAEGSGNSWQGDVLCGLSAVCHGLSSVLLKRWMPDDEAINMPMFFGFIGLFNLVICIPILFLLDWTAVEPLQPISMQAGLYLALNGILGTVVSNVLWAKAVVLTSPLVVNLGTSLAIPLAFGADALNPYSEHSELKWQYVLGAVMVVGAFLSVNITVEDSTQRMRPRAISIGSSGGMVVN